MEEGYNKVAVVTGSSSGIGRGISFKLARNGFTTCATTRNLTKSSDVGGIPQTGKNYH